MTYLVWFFVVALLGLFVYCCIQAGLEASERWRLEKRIERIGHDSITGAAERISARREDRR